VAEGASADHGHSHATGRGQWRDEEAGLVAYAAGGVLVDGGLAQPGGRELFSGVARGQGQRARLVEDEPAQPGGHQPGGELFKRNGAVCRAGDEEADLAAVQCAAVALFCGSGRWCAEARLTVCCAARKRK